VTRVGSRMTGGEIRQGKASLYVVGFGIVGLDLPARRLEWSSAIQGSRRVLARAERPPGTTVDILMMFLEATHSHCCANRHAPTGTFQSDTHQISNQRRPVDALLLVGMD
jgi:hypothetical protein